MHTRPHPSNEPTLVDDTKSETSEDLSQLLNLPTQPTTHLQARDTEQYDEHIDHLQLPPIDRQLYPYAPPPLHLTPFIPIQETATREILSQIHPNLGISRTAITVVMRFQDRLAHYLLQRAYEGLNTPTTDASGEEEDGPIVPPPSDSSSTTSPNVQPDGHELIWRFPEYVHNKILTRHANSEAIKAVQRAARMGENFENYGSIGLQFGAAMGDRWIHDFICGLNKKAAEAKGQTSTTGCEEACCQSQQNMASNVRITDMSILHLTMQQQSAKISLCAFIEYITAEILELSGNRAQDFSNEAIDIEDIWAAIVRDEEMYQVWSYLPIDWNVPLGDPKPLSLSSTSIGTGELPTFVELLDREFREQSKAMTALNASSWYMDSTKLLSIAQQFARGERTETELTRSLRALHVRPFRFWGCDTYSLLSERPSHDDDIDIDENEDAPSALGFVYVSILVTDRLGEEWHLMLEISPNQNWRGSVIELHSIGGVLGHLHRTIIGQDTLTVALHQVRYLKKYGGIVYRAHEINDEVIPHDEQELEVQILQQIKTLQDQLRLYAERKAAAKQKRKAELLGGFPPTLQKAESIEREVRALDAPSPAKPPAKRLYLTTSFSATTPAAGTKAATESKSDSSSASSSSSSAASSKKRTASSNAISLSGNFNPLEILARETPLPSVTATSAQGIPNLQYSSTKRLDLIARSLNQVTTQVESSQTQSELERIIPQVLHLIRFSHYGPTLYVHNQPLSIRLMFTTTLIDEAMKVMSLPSLPTVLLDLIAGYVPLDLPFLPDEAAQQMQRTNALPYPPPPTRALYPGQLNHALERHNQLTCFFDDVLPPFEEEDIDEVDDDGEELPQEEEEGEDDENEAEGEDDDDDDDESQDGDDDEEDDESKEQTDKGKSQTSTFNGGTKRKG